MYGIKCQEETRSFNKIIIIYTLHDNGASFDAATSTWQTKHRMGESQGYSALPIFF